MQKWKTVYELDSPFLVSLDFLNLIRYNRSILLFTNGFGSAFFSYKFTHLSLEKFTISGVGKRTSMRREEFWSGLAGGHSAFAQGVG